MPKMQPRNVWSPTTVRIHIHVATIDVNHNIHDAHIKWYKLLSPGATNSTIALSIKLNSRLAYKYQSSTIYFTKKLS
jgi:hypothetical protein